MISTTCVIVGFGDRGDTAANAARSALRAGAASVVVVDNGLTASAQMQLREALVSDADRVQIIKQENRGSAGGFASGIQRAAELNPKGFLLLLDDDNLAEPEALRALHAAWQRAKGSVDGPLLLAGYRHSRPYLRDLVGGRPQSHIFPKASAFAGLNPVATLTRTGKRADKQTTVAGMPVLPFAPYGGFFGRASDMVRFGLPDERFFLYEDDKEFSARMIKNGATILLCKDALIDDVEHSWFLAATTANPVHAMLLADDEFRIFYLLRNRSFLETHDKRTLLQSVVRSINGAIFYLVLFGGGLRHRRMGRARCIARAIRDGKQAKLGATY